MAAEFKDRLAALVAGWTRVGFCQGNFNADNCLVGGRTMDYGPFGSDCCFEFLHVFHPVLLCSGFVDVFDAEWCSWTGGAPHFSFMNQLQAAHANFDVFARNLLPLLDAYGVQQMDAIRASFPVSAKMLQNQAMAAKLGASPALETFDQLQQTYE
jgi:uncharacterized protein YdiU (UPF0061 family)